MPNEGYTAGVVEVAAAEVGVAYAEEAEAEDTRRRDTERGTVARVLGALGALPMPPRTGLGRTLALGAVVWMMVGLRSVSGTSSQYSTHATARKRCMWYASALSISVVYRSESV